mgnify:CR=1 FL=1
MHTLFKFKAKIHMFINFLFNFVFFASGFILGRSGSLQNLKELFVGFFRK